MKEKYFYIESEKARELLAQTEKRKSDKRGIDRHVYLFDEYVVLTTERIKLRNVTIRDDELTYFDELIKTLMNLREQGVAVIPILGYCFDPDSENGNGYIFQPRAKGEELYDDAIMKEYYVWAQNNINGAYLSSEAEPKQYILSRTNFISQIPQKHFDKFINDIIVLFDNDVLIDFNGKSNFFYDDIAGIQFIDIDSHSDYKYGLVEQKYNSKELASYYGFTPCHVAVGTKLFPHLALDEKSVLKMDEKDLHKLKEDNKTIFEKCKNAILNNGIPKEQFKKSLELLKIFGC